MTPPSDDTAQSQGDLLWGVRDSFVRYIEVTGSIEASEPASREEGNIMRFPGVQHDERVLRFSGAVSFRAHHGMLSLTIKDPWIESTDRSDVAATLTVLDVSQCEPAGIRVILAEISHQGTVTLAPTGVALFDFHYPAGTELDPVVVSGGARRTLSSDRQELAESALSAARTQTEK